MIIVVVVVDGMAVTAGVVVEVVVVVVVGPAFTGGATVTVVVVVTLDEQAPAANDQTMMNATRRRNDLLRLQMVSARWLSSPSGAAT